MNTKYTIAAVAVIVLIVSAALIIYYQGQVPDEDLEALQSLVDDNGYETSLTAYPEKIISLVLLSCITSPLSKQRMCKSCGSIISSDVTKTGPIRQNVSRLLPLTH